MKNLDKVLEKIKNNQSVKVLGIESSCDETSVSVVENGRNVLSCIIASQIDIHKRFGGVVPEVASRNHTLAISNVYKQALEQANCTLEDIDAIAVTYGAGLIGALLVGVSFAKGLAYASNKPLIAVSHVKGHICSNYLTYQDLQPPFCCLMVSGGHTAIIKVEDYNKISMLGTTVDDAVGEAFDKVARVLGLGYPGGPMVEKMAQNGQKNISFVNKNIMPGSYNFSFSGIKTAVINYVHKQKQNNQKVNISDVCASFQDEVCTMLTNKTVKACLENKLDKIVVAGGVGANTYLKNMLTKKCEESNIKCFFPDLKYCTDNAAMIASEGYFMIKSGQEFANLDLSAKSTVPLV